MEPLEAPHSDHEIAVSDGEPPPRPPSPVKNERNHIATSRDSGDKMARKLGLRPICSQAPKRSNKRGRPICSKDAMTSPVIVGLLASDRMGAGSLSMEDSSGDDDDDGKHQRSGHRVRKIKWTEHLIKVFLELFDRELAALNYMQKVPHANGKMRIVRDFNARTGIELPWESFKHKYDNLRRLYIAWEKLAGYNDISIDSITGKITMDDQWWNDRESEVPLSKTLHHNPIPHMDLMHRIFKNSSIKRDNSSSPNTSALHTVVVTTVDPCKTSDQTIPTATPVPTCEPSLSEDPTSTESPITPSSSIAPSPLRSYREQLRSATFPIANQKGTRHSRRCVSRRRTALNATEFRMYQEPMLVTFKEAFSALNKLGIAKFTDFWWASVRVLKDDMEWRESFLELSSDGEKIAFLEGLTGYDRNNNYVGLKGLQAFAEQRTQHSR
ncbi:PREDICTED: uncharacterized protein LOC104819338 isoform X2 [Tarenaya hassleriana]|uniref:uncharacterized protein LOC104819338 isoform X2 n=1 Tax=Tarenaya hassleriana TaxID=28532 RepID=UPI00053C1550|nr:PREDICTED: uncharacterized protein LOC104819338 isoform X2 [Tarenaya hassleriana]